jgi:hypothetical protein
MEYSDVLASMFEEVDTLFQPQQPQHMKPQTFTAQPFQNLQDKQSVNSMLNIAGNHSTMYTDMQSFDSPLFSAVQSPLMCSPIITPDLLYSSTPSMASFSPQMHDLTPFCRQMAVQSESALQNQFKAQERILRNRQASEQSRKRKKDSLHNLEEETMKIVQENKLIRVKIKRLKQAS